MADEFDNIISAPLSCPEYGEKFAAKLGLLKTHNAIPCPHCGVAVDLTEPERRAYINKHAEQAASIFPRFEDFVKKRR